MRQESGRSMVEIIGVISIMALITAGAFVLIRNSMAAQRRSRIMDDVSKIVTGIRSLYAEYDALESLDSDSALAAMSVDANGPDGVTYSVSVDNHNNAYDRFVVTVSGLSNKDCTVFKIQTWTDAVENPTCSGGELEITYDK